MAVHNILHPASLRRAWLPPTPHSRQVGVLCAASAATTTASCQLQGCMGQVHTQTGSARHKEQRQSNQSMVAVRQHPVQVMRGCSTIRLEPYIHVPPNLPCKPSWALAIWQGEWTWPGLGVAQHGDHSTQHQTQARPGPLPIASAHQNTPQPHHPELPPCPVPVVV